MVDALDVTAPDAAVDHDHVAKGEEEEEERSQPTMLQHFDRRVKQRGPKTAERKSPSRPVRTAQAADDQDSTKTRPQRSAAKGTAAAERGEFGENSSHVALFLDSRSAQPWLSGRLPVHVPLAPRLIISLQTRMMGRRRRREMMT